VIVQHVLCEAFAAAAAASCLPFPARLFGCSWAMQDPLLYTLISSTLTLTSHMLVLLALQMREKGQQPRGLLNSCLQLAHRYNFPFFVLLPHSMLCARAAV
jgi:hypothetical protein